MSILKKIPWKYYLYAMMLAYVIYMALSMSYMKSMMSEVHSIELASRENRETRTSLHAMENLVPTLLSISEFSYGDVENELLKLEKAQDDVVARLRTLFPGDPTYLASLESSVWRLRGAVRGLALELEHNTNHREALQRFKNRVQPFIKEVSEKLDNLSRMSDNRISLLESRIDSWMLATTILAILIGSFIIVLVMIADRREKVRSRRITAREALFSQVFKNIDEVFLVAANAGHMDYASPNCGRMLDVQARQILAEPDAIYKIFSKDDSEWLKDMLSGKLSGENDAERDATIPAARKICRIRVYPLEAADTGKIDQYIISISDQTEAIERQKALKDALDAAHAAFKAKSSFLSHMSHEIRTPMNAIIGMTTIALSRLDDKARVEDCLAKISESSRHLLGIINDVLDMSKLESGKLSLSHDEFNLHKCIENVGNLAREQTSAKQQDFEILSENVVNSELVGDPLRLNQVLLNILSNASKFTPAGGKVVFKIQQAHSQGAMAHFRFTISDTGIGMSKEFLERIYEPFEQATSSTITKFGGSGLGMPITANLVSLMGGVISVESAEGKGTTFTVELPFELSSVHRYGKDQLPPLDVLLVDDDAGTCQHASLLLEQMGMNVTCALDGADAIHLARKAHESGKGYDVCLIDWKMPGMNGAETATGIRKAIGDDMLMIIMSAYDWSAIEAEARQAGVNDFIAKPFFSSNLYDALAVAAKNLENGCTENADVQKEYDFTGKRVLLVEDNDFNREISQEFLEIVNVEVDHATNGHEAVAIFTSAPKGYYDLVLMDVQMPVMNGYDATRAIRASTHPDARSICIIAMTANAFNDDVTHAVAAGMNGHVAKPVDVHELYRVLAKNFKKD